MVLLAVLASTEFYQPEGIPPTLQHKHLVLSVQSNGLCFWSCCWLFLEASTKQLIGWHHRSRNAQGFPGPPQCDWERDIVKNWAMKIFGMPEPCKQRVMEEHSAEDEDIEPSIEL